MTGFLTVSEVARQLGIRPRDVSDLFYQRRLDDLECPIIGGRRLIPLQYLPFVKAALHSSCEVGEGTPVDHS